MPIRIACAWLCAFQIFISAYAEPPSDPLSSERPLFIFSAPGNEAPDSLAHADVLLSAWQELPESLRAYSAFQLESPVTDEGFWADRFRDVLRELQFASIPVVVNIAKADPRAVYPLHELAQLLEEFTIIRAVHVEGFTFNEYYVFGEMDPMAMPPQARWLMEAVEVVGRYGRRITIELDELHWLRLMSNAWCKPLYDTLRRHAAHVIPLNRQRGPHNLARMGAMMGLWLEGAADQWGIESSSAWYREAGFIEPGVFGVAGDDSPMPEPFYRAMLLNGAMTGAAVYRFSEADDLWFGPRRSYWFKAILPTLTEMLEKGYIARKDLVQRKTRIAYRLNPSESSEEFHANLADIDAVYGEGRMIRGAYGIERPGQVPELIPNTGRYYWIPILSPYAPDETLRGFEEVILPGALLDAQTWRERLDLYYRPDGLGSAFISRVGRGIFVLHTRENLHEAQPFRVEGVPSPLRGITAQRHPEGIALTWPFREGDLFYRVYRRVPPDTDYALIAKDIDTRRFLDRDVGGKEIVAYAVTALTNEREPQEGVVNYGDYLVINTAESRIDEEVIVDSFTSSATSAPIPPRIETRPEKQSWWPTGLETLDPNEGFSARGIVARIEEWELAFSEENLERILDIYAADYSDAEGRGRVYVESAYQLFFKLYRVGPMHRQIRRWDFSAYAQSGEVNVVMYCRFTGLDETGPMGRYTDIPVEFPDAPTREVRLTFVKRDDVWRLLSTDPPLPKIDDFLVQR